MSVARLRRLLSTLSDSEWKQTLEETPVFSVFAGETGRADWVGVKRVRQWVRMPSKSTHISPLRCGLPPVFPIVVSTDDLGPGRFGERARHMRLELESATTKYQRATRVLQRLGMPVRDGKFEFTVTKVDGGKTQIGNQYLNTKAQGQFCLGSMTVTNIGTEPQMFSSINQKAIDAQGRELSADVTAGAYLEDSKFFIANINPGNTVKGTIVFDVPKTSQITHVLLHDSMLSNGATVKVA